MTEHQETSPLKAAKLFPDTVRSTVDQDSELARRARGGSLDAFAQLVERHRDLVYRVCARIVGPDDADDVAQEAFLRAFHRISRFRGEGPFRGWLLRIAHRAALDALERRKRISTTPSDELEDMVALDGPHTATPADELEVSERRERLERKLGQLRPAHRSVIVLRDLEGFSYEEISTLTAQPLGSVKGRLHRARGELIEILRSNTYDWELPDEQ
jgi:RNA polymerase sigma-70 factor (ECF subfamily)